MKQATPEILIPEEAFRQKLGRIKAWIFDWDGIFNDGTKDQHGNNTFSERDSMGTNMLRYATYLRSGVMPYCAVITGANNETPVFFAQREHFHAVIRGAKYKRDVVEIYLKEWGIQPDEVAFFFDDILDLNVCELVGLRIQVRYPSGQNFNQYVDDNQLADLATHTSGRDQAIREVADFIIGHWGLTHETIHGRMHMSNAYEAYWEQRQAIPTNMLSRDELLEQHNQGRT